VTDRLPVSQPLSPGRVLSPGGGWTAKSLVLLGENAFFGPFPSPVMLRRCTTFVQSRLPEGYWNSAYGLDTEEQILACTKAGQL